MPTNVGKYAPPGIVGYPASAWSVAPTSSGFGPQTYQPQPVVPAVKPDDPEMMNFIALDDIQLDKDEIKRAKLEGKRKEFLKTDLTWKQVLFVSNNACTTLPQDLAGCAHAFGYEYVCRFGKISKIIPFDNSYLFEDTGLTEDDINEIL